MAALAHAMLFALFFVPRCGGVDKQWILNTDWENADNWGKGRLPCAADHVITGSEGSASVFSLRHSTSIGSLVLPVTGEMIFLQDVEMLFSADSAVASSCPDAAGEIQFIASAGNWYDPNNWIQIKPPVDNETTETTPLMERVPCKSDSAIFPQGSSFAVESHNPVAVAKILLEGQAQSQAAFAAYCASESGRKQFKFSRSSSDVVITGKECSDATGCPCGNMKFKKTICSFVKCNEPTCEQPLQPEGECCPICGAILDIEFSKDFVLSDFKRRLQRVAKEESGGVRFSIYRKEKSDAVEVMLVDSAEGTRNAQKLATSLRKELLSDSNSEIVGVELRRSGGTESESRDASGPGPVKTVAITAGVFVFLLCVILISCLLWRKNKRRRLENRVGERSFVPMEDFEMDETGQKVKAVVDEQDPDQPSINPLYDFGHTDRSSHCAENPIYEAATA